MITNGTVRIYAVVEVVVGGLMAETEEGLISMAIDRSGLHARADWDGEIARYEVDLGEDGVGVFQDREFLTELHEDRLAGAGVFAL